MVVQTHGGAGRPSPARGGPGSAVRGGPALPGPGRGGPGSAVRGGAGRGGPAWPSPARGGAARGYQMAGWRSFQGLAASSWADSEIRVPSSPIRPASMTPMGSPASVQCSGTFTAG